jgi:serine/threonine protein kinase
MNGRRSVRKQRSVHVRRTHGGQYIGEGTYGCVFDPALKCKRDKTRRKDTISKLMNVNIAKDEYKQKQLLESVNSKQRYFIYPTTLCRPKIPFSKYNHVEQCTLNKLGMPNHKLADQTRGIRLLQIPLGGRDLTKVELTPTNIYPIFKSFINLFDGLMTLHAAGIVHVDVKSDNIVTKNIGHEHWHSRFIDFGLSFKIADYDSIHYQGIFQQNFLFRSPDVRFIDINHIIHPKIDVDDWLFEIQRLKILTDDFIYTVVDGVYEPIINVEYYKRLRNKLRVLSEHRRHTFLLINNDIYAFGMTLMDFYIYNVCSSLRAISPILFDNFVRVVEPTFLKFISKLVTFDPFQRISLKEARHIYIKQVLPAIKQSLMSA